MKLDFSLCVSSPVVPSVKVTSFYSPQSRNKAVVQWCRSFDCYGNLILFLSRNYFWSKVILRLINIWIWGVGHFNQNWLWSDLQLRSKGGTKFFSRSVLYVCFNSLINQFLLTKIAREENCMSRQCESIIWCSWVALIQVALRNDDGFLFAPWIIKSNNGLHAVMFQSA